MNAHEARTRLETPVFGDVACIEALDVLRLAADLENAREWANDSETGEWLDPSELRDMETMNPTEMFLELSEYYDIGYGEDHAA